MSLKELEPRWIHPNVFVFLCPHCRNVLLACKNIAMSTHDQFRLFAATLGDEWNKKIVPMNSTFAWAISGADFGDLSVTPSIDAGASGHWHGHITNGEIV